MKIAKAIVEIVRINLFFVDLKIAYKQKQDNNKNYIIVSVDLLFKTDSVLEIDQHSYWDSRLLDRYFCCFSA